MVRREPRGSVREAQLRRHGFSLVEVLAALVLLGVAALSVTAGSTWAARLLTRAERAERAADLAALVLDSLVQVREPADGERVGSAAHLRWQVRPEVDGARRIELRFLSPPRLRDVAPLVVVVGPPRPVLVPVPEAP